MILLRNEEKYTALTLVDIGATVYGDMEAVTVSDDARIGTTRRAWGEEKVVSRISNKFDTKWGVIHGDTRPGSLVLDSAGQPALVDWQLVPLGACSRVL
jgi:aminoglycoside phosphotransferase (APT) family kinase protein